MKTRILISMLTFFVFSPIFSQSDDIPLDESLIIRFAKVATGGYLSKMELAKATALEANEKDAVIISFEYICVKEGYEANIHNKGAELSQQILNHLKNAKIGTKVSFENIRIENASGEVLAKPLLLTIKS